MKNNWKYKLKRTFTILVAFAVGWILYMIGVFIFPYDGILGLIIQPILGALISGVVVILSFLIDLLIRKLLPPELHPGKFYHLIVVIICLFLLMFGSKIGLSQQYINPELETTFMGINATVGIISYFLIIFSLVNWPIKPKADLVV